MEIIQSTSVLKDILSDRPLTIQEQVEQKITTVDPEEEKKLQVG